MKYGNFLTTDALFARRPSTNLAKMRWVLHVECPPSSSIFSWAETVCSSTCSWENSSLSASSDWIDWLSHQGFFLHNLHVDIFHRLMLNLSTRKCHSVTNLSQDVRGSFVADRYWSCAGHGRNHLFLFSLASMIWGLHFAKECKSNGCSQLCLSFISWSLFPCLSCPHPAYTRKPILN